MRIKLAVLALQIALCLPGFAQKKSGAPPKNSPSASEPCDEKAIADPIREAVLPKNKVDQLPKVIRNPDPKSTKEARRAKIHGPVVLTLIVDSNGCPRDIRVMKPAGKGLDEEAVEAVRDWRFKPAMKDGKPVAMMINVEIHFRY